MPYSSILTPKQLDEFHHREVLRLAGLLSAETVRRAREAVLRPLERLGLWKAAAWHLDALPRPQWPDGEAAISRVINSREVLECRSR